MSFSTKYPVVNKNYIPYTTVAINRSIYLILNKAEWNLEGKITSCFSFSYKIIPLLDSVKDN